jgi:pentatricopeptide repeat protein
MLTAGLRPNAATFHTIMSTLIERDEVDKALAILKIMGSSKYSSQPPSSKSYGILIHGLAESKRPDEAVTLLEEMYRLNLRPEVQSYTVVVRSYEKAGRPLKAIEVMENMRENGYEFYDVKVSDTVFVAHFSYISFLSPPILFNFSCNIDP